MEKFGNIKDTFNKIIFESVINKDEKSKKIFSKYVKKLNENENLTNQFLIYKNLQHKTFETIDEAKEYVKENISLLKELNESDLKSGNEYLQQLLENKEIVKTNDSFYSMVEYLVKTKKSPSNIEKINETINTISSNMLVKEEVEETKFDTVGLPLSVLSDLAVNKFNTKFSDLNESEKDIIKTLLNGSDDDKLNIYKKLKSECIESVNEKLTETTDLDLKDKLLKVKDKILNMAFDTNNSKEDIIKLHQLKNSF